MEPGERRAALAAFLRREVARAARVPSSRVDGGLALTALGVDSLAALTIQHSIEQGLGIRVSLADLLEGISVAELVERLHAGQPESSPAGEPEPWPAPKADATALSHGQRALWFLHRLAPSSAAYHVAAAAEVAPALDTEALRRALVALVSRHGVLRTTFHESAGEPRSELHSRRSPEFVVEEAWGTGPSELAETVERHAARPFDLSEGPLVRMIVFRRPPAGDVVLLVLHHLVADFWSMSILVRELGELYAGAGTGEAGPPVSPAPTYADFVRSEAELLAGPGGERLWQYWKRELGGSAPVLELPTDRPRPAVQTYAGAVVRRRLGVELAAGTAVLARRSEATPFMVQLALFQALLHRYGGQSEVRVGSPMAGRGRAELAGLVGYLTGPVVLRALFGKRPRVLELLAQVRRRVLEALAHQAFPFPLLVERLRPDEDPSRSPLFQVMFVWYQTPAGAAPGLVPFALGEAGGRLELGDHEARSIELPERTSQFDLTLRMGEVEGSLHAAVQFNTDLFDTSTADRLLAHLATLVESAVAEPERRIGELEILTPRERFQLVSEWNGGPRPGRAAALRLHELFEIRAAETPEAEALRAPDASLTYGELERRSNRLARLLRRRGVGPERRVGVCLERTPELVVSLLAVLKADGAYVPLDPAYPAERRRFMLRDSGADVVISRRPAAASVTLAPEAAAAERSSPPASSAAPDGLAYVIYTSGSTGRPKGVAISHRSAVELVAWAQETYSPEELSGVLAATSVCFDLSVFEIFVPLAAGGRVILAADALALAELPAASRVTLVNTVPSAMAVLAEGGLPASLTTVNLAGEPLKASLVEAVYRHRQIESVWNLYGPSEDTTYSTGVRLPRSGARVTIGTALPGRRSFVADRRLELLAVGAPGELLVGGPGLARGYLDRPGLTAERFVPDPLSGATGSRLYRTGDLVRRLAAGEIDFLGRIDHQVKVRGYRIELGEIESALLEAPGVRECVAAVRGLASAEGPAAPALVAWVAPGPGDARALADRLARRLPSYMVPSFFVFLPALPLLPNGKVDRAALPRPEGAGGVAAEEARTPTEEIVAEFFADLLALGGVGRAAHFFDLGGHSLLAAQVVSRVREVFRVELPLRSVFEAPRVADLAARIDDARRRGGGPPLAPIEPAPRDAARSFPLSFAQRRLWFLDQLQPGSSAYVIPAATRLRGKLDLAVLEAALNEITRRHETLRTTFEVEAGEPVQVIGGPRSASLPVVDLRRLADRARRSQARRLARREATRPFDLERGPLLATRLLQLDETEHVLLAALHHIVGDGWSLAVLARELEALYGAFSTVSGRRSTALPRLPIQFVDFVRWQRRQLSGAVLEAQLGYWRERLAGLPPVLELPADRPRPAIATRACGSRPLALSEQAVASLRELGRGQGSTLFMTLLALFQVLLHRYSGQTDLAVGSPVAGRGHARTEGLIGFFVNMLVLRGDLAGDPRLAVHLRRVREVTLEAFEHQDVPFEKLVEELAPARDVTHTPLFQVAFAWQNVPRTSTGASGLVLEAVPVESAVSKFDLTCFIRPPDAESGGLRGEIEFSRDLFDAASISRLVEHFATLVASSGGARRISELDLLTGAERAQLVVEANDHPGAAVERRAVHELFERHAALHPAAPAVAAPGRVTTYGELGRRANRLANVLRGLGVGPDVAVALYLERSAELVTAALAVLKAGGAYVPLDPSYPIDRLAFMVDDVGAPVLVSAGTKAGDLSRSGIRVLRLDAEAPLIEAASQESPQVEVDPENLAYVIYTSGSTGRPKGVEVTHRGLSNLVAWHRRRFAVTRRDRATHLSGLSFDASVWDLWPYLSVGAVVCQPDEPSRSHPDRLVEWLVAQGITVGFVPTPVAEAVLGRSWPAAASLRFLLTGGDRLSSHPSPDLPFHLINNYGPTENTVVATSGRVPEAGRRRRAPTIGRPMDNVAVYLLDRAMSPVPLAVPGELHVGGPGLARGYLGRGALTAGRFVPDPLSGRAGSRLYRTGDVARYQTGGEIEFLGRDDQQVKVRGFRIELGEIEASLSACPEVREAVVVARDDLPAGRALVAYAVPENGHRLSVDAIRDELGSRLPDYMVPSFFVELGALPLTENGKVDREALPSPAVSQVEAHRRPRTPVEKLLADIFADVLGVDQVGVEDNFFHLGGHSLLATTLTSRVREAFQVELPLRCLFESPTVAGLASALAAHEGTPGHTEKVARILERVRAMSGEEFQGLLARARESRPS